MDPSQDTWLRAIKQKAASATLWSAVEAMARQALQFSTTLVLARLLTPEDYGTLGLLSIFIAVVAVFIDSGFSSALIQRKEISDADVTSVFWFNIGAAVVAAGLLGAASPWIAAFYRMPVLRPLTWLLAGTLVIGSLGTVQTTLLTRALDFRRQCIISVCSVVVSGAIAISLALRHYGVWTLGIQNLAATTVSVALLWLSSSWRPRAAFSMASIRSLFGFGGFLLLSSMLDKLFTRLNSLVIGKFYSAKDLGFYSRAESASGIPANLMTSVLSRVAFPVFAAAKQDSALLRAGLRKAITTAMMLNIPLMLGLAVTARPLVSVLYGEKWLPCVPYFQILCLGFMLWPLHVLNLNVLSAQGYSNLFFRLEIIKKSVGILLMGTACPFGVAAIAWAWVFSGIIGLALNAYYSGRFLAYGLVRQLQDLLPYFAAGAAMAICAGAAALLPLHGPLQLLAAQVVVGVAVYTAICAALGLRAFVEARAMVTRRFSSRAVRAPLQNPNDGAYL